jgi:hypothetical protein
MTRLAVITQITMPITPDHEPRTVYVNPLNVTFVVPLHHGTAINFNDGETVTTSMEAAVAVRLIEKAME